MGRDVLSGKRHKVSDSTGRFLYVTVMDDEEVGTPCELWVTLPDENKPSEQKLKTDITTVAALFSLARESGARYTKALQAMRDCCYHKHSIPAQIINILETHCPMAEATMREFEAEEVARLELLKG